MRPVTNSGVARHEPRQFAALVEQVGDIGFDVELVPGITHRSIDQRIGLELGHDVVGVEPATDVLADIVRGAAFVGQARLDMRAARPHRPGVARGRRRLEFRRDRQARSLWHHHETAVAIGIGANEVTDVLLGLGIGVGRRRGQ